LLAELFPVLFNLFGLLAVFCVSDRWPCGSNGQPHPDKTTEHLGQFVAKIQGQWPLLDLLLCVGSITSGWL